MWTNSWKYLLTLILLWPLQARAANFTFAYGAASECDDFQVSWTGGTPPFQLTVVVPYGTPRTLDIPADNFSNGKGTFAATLPVGAGKQIIAVMSDSTGFASGGISKVIPVGKSSGKNTCNSTDPGVDFTYEANDALAQCRLEYSSDLSFRSYSFTNYDKAVQPVTIVGVVPGGSSFVLNPPRGPSFEWIADVKAGTSIVFIMTDAQGRKGGSSQVYTVGLSDDATCLDKNSPASVTNAPSRTTSAGSKPTGSKTATNTATATASSGADNGSSSKTSTGTVVAAVIACLVAAFIVGTLVWFFLKRRRGRGRGTSSVFKGRLFGKFQKQEVDLMHDPSVPPSSAVSPYPLYHSPADIPGSVPNSTADLLGGGGGAARPSGDLYGSAASGYTPSSARFAQQPPSSAATSQFPPHPLPPSAAAAGVGAAGAAAAYTRGSVYDGSGSVHGRPDEGSTASWDQTVTSSMRRKAAAAGVSPYAPSARFILHTDIDDDPPPPPDDEIIELPPQYSERRAPAPALQPVAAGSGSQYAAGVSSPGASGSGSGAHYAQASDLPPPPSPTGLSTSPGLAYLSDRASYAPSEHSIPSYHPSRPS
ncbi:hypothetical protein OH77DRAFT_1433536 [Trametes cingulata]|nr:hypothetical protein OH77DRAFT_1433536 [Trametes cingulata]